MSKIQGPWGELTAETGVVDVTSSSPRPDHNWTFTDGHGHEHYWRDGYPTLVSEPVGEPYYCEDCGDEHQDTRLVCRLCGEEIAPDSIGPSGFREFIPGRTDYRLNGEPISPERFAELRQQWRPGP